MELTKSALSMLLKKYKAVLRKCFFNNLALGMLVGGAILGLGSAGTYAATPETVEVKAGVTVTVDQSLLGGNNSWEGQLDGTVEQGGTLEVIDGVNITLDAGSQLSNSGTVNLDYVANARDTTISNTATGEINLQQNSNFTSYDTTVENAGNISITGEGNINSGSVTNTGDIDVDGTLKLLNQNTFTNEKTVNVGSNGTISFSETTQFNNKGDLNITGTANFTDSFSSVSGGNIGVTNDANITVNDGGKFNSTYVVVDNNGTIGGSGDFALNETLLNNANTIDVDGSFIFHPGSVVDNSAQGTVNVNKGGEFGLYGAAYVNNGKSVVDGTLTANGSASTGEAQIKPGVKYGITNLSEMEINGTLQLLETSTLTNEADGVLTINENGKLDESKSEIYNNGTINIKSQGNTASISQFNNMGTVNLDGTLEFSDNSGQNGLSNSENANFNVNKGASLSATETALQNSGTFMVAGDVSLGQTTNMTNDGTVQLDGTFGLTDSASITNNAEGVFNVNSAGQFTGTGGGIHNEGKLTVAGELSGTDYFTIYNNGSVAVDGTVGLSNSSLTQESPDGILTVNSNGKFSGTSASINNSGKFEIAGSMDLSDASNMINMGALDLTGTLDLSGKSRLNNNFDGTLTVNSGATLTAADSTFENHATANIAGTANLSEASSLTNFGTMDVSGTLDLTGDSSLTNEQAATLNVLDQGLISATKATIKTESDSTLAVNEGGKLNVSASTMTNGGKTNIAGEAKISGASSLTNSGDIEVGGTMGVTGKSTVLNKGGASLNVDDKGTLTVTDSTFNADSGSTLLVKQGGQLSVSASTMTTAGTTNIAGVADISEASSITNSGTVEVSGNMDLTGKSSLTNSEGGNLSVQNNGLVSATDSTISSESNSYFTVMEGGKLNASASTITNDGNASIEGEMNLSDASSLTNSGIAMGVSGTLNLTGKSSLTNTGANLSVENNGFISATDSTISNDTNLTVFEGGKLNASASTVTNSGTARIDGEMNISDASSLTNSGSMDVQGTVGLTGKSSLVNSEGQQLNVYGGGLLNSSASSLENNGTMNISGEASLSEASSFDNSGTLDVVGTLGLTGKSTLVNNEGKTTTIYGYSNGKINAIDSSVENKGTLNVEGDLLLSEASSLTNAGTMAVTGTLGVDGGSTLTNNANQNLNINNGGKLLATASTVTNNGNSNILGEVNLSDSSSYTNAGNVGLIGQMYLTEKSSFINNGTFTADPVSSINASGSTFENNGTSVFAGSSAFTDSSSIINSKDLDLKGTFSLAKATTLENKEGGTVTVNPGAQIISDASTINNSGNVNIGGTVTLNNKSTLTNAEKTGQVNLTGRMNLDNASLENNGQIKLAGQVNLNNSSTFTNSGSMTFNGGSANYAQIYLNGHSTFVNNSDLSVGSYANISVPSGTIENNGNMKIAGAVNLQNSDGNNSLLVNNGTVQVACTYIPGTHPRDSVGGLSVYNKEQFDSLLKGSVILGHLEPLPDMVNSALKTYFNGPITFKTSDFITGNTAEAGKILVGNMGVLSIHNSEVQLTGNSLSFGPSPREYITVDGVELSTRAHLNVDYLNIKTDSGNVFSLDSGRIIMEGRSENPYLKINDGEGTFLINGSGLMLGNTRTGRVGGQVIGSIQVGEDRTPVDGTEYDSALAINSGDWTVTGDLTLEKSGSFTVGQASDDITGEPLEAHLIVDGAFVAKGGIFSGINLSELKASTFIANKDFVLDLGGEVPALFQAGNIVFNGGQINFDPPFGVAGDISNASMGGLEFASNNMDARINIGRNSMVTLGSQDVDWLQTQIGNYQEITKSLWGEGITAALGIRSPQVMAAIGGLNVDGTWVQGGAPAATNKAKFADKSLLVVDASGVKDGVALDGNGTGALEVDSGAKLYVTDAGAGDEITITNNFASSNVSEDGWAKNTTTSSELLNAESKLVDADTGEYVVKIVQAESASAAFPDLSPELDSVVNAVVMKGLDTNSSNPGVRFISRAVDNRYIGMTNKELAAKTIESAARIAIVGAVPQLTMKANEAAGAAVTQRTSFAQPDGMLQSTDGNANPNTGIHANSFALWVMPLYQSTNGFSMEAGNFDYDFNGALGGVALGADYTFENMLRLGLSFNIGGGYARGTGGLNKTTNNMDFWGIGAYAGWTMNNFGLTADVNYTSTYNKVKQELPYQMAMSDLKSDITAWAISTGLRAEYQIKTDILDIVPHLGFRFWSVNTDSYNVNSGGTVLDGDSITQNIWTFPIGVSLTKKFELENGWNIKPLLDLNITPATGDIKAKANVQFTGTGEEAELKTKMMDYVTYGGTAGIEIGNENLSFGINYNGQFGAESSAHGVFATFRYEF